MSWRKTYHASSLLLFCRPLAVSNPRTEPPWAASVYSGKDGYPENTLFGVSSFGVCSPRLLFSPPCLNSCLSLFAFCLLGSFVYSFTISGKPKILLKINSECIRATLLWLSSGTKHTWTRFATTRLLLDHRTALFTLGCPYLAMLQCFF